MEEARLRMLQAQIEPHFLFNTLASVRRLYQTAPSDGAAMLDHLMRYLEVALPQMRAAASTLEREAALTRSYLEIQRLRMGHRLSFDIDIPQALREASVPPMMLVTLAENAIKHGLAPLPGGGHVGVSATVYGAELQVQVADSGQGFTHSSGGGTGLANIRARLAAMYGDRGRLSLALNTPRGVVATIDVPLSPPAQVAA
jgi:LytS/YehU family sensor histidine kinase